MSSYLSLYELLHELIVQRSAVVNRYEEKDKAACCANKHDCRLGEHVGGLDTVNLMTKSGIARQGRIYKCLLSISEYQGTE